MCANPFTGDGWERRDKIKESERKRDMRRGEEPNTGRDVKEAVTHINAV